MSSVRQDQASGYALATATCIAAAIFYCAGAEFARAAAPPADVRSAGDLYHAGEYRQAIEMLDQLLRPSSAKKLPAPVLYAALQLAVDVNKASGRFDEALKYAQAWQKLLERQAAESPTNINGQRQAADLAVADLQMSLDKPEDAEKSI